jgi:hypothetical protein
VCELVVECTCSSGRFARWQDNPPASKWQKRKKGQRKLKFPKAPWTMYKDDIPKLEAIFPRLKIPSTWPPVRPFFTDLGFMKTSETLLYAGDAGAYFLRHMDIDPDCRALFIRLLRVTQRFTRAHTTHTHTHIYTHIHTPSL